jgi:hypothetical protein
MTMRDRDAIYQDILALARRRIQDAALCSDPRRVAIEKAHLAVIPPLLHCRDDRRHRHYLDVDRPRLLRHCLREIPCEFEPLWTELVSHLPEVLPPEPPPPPMAKIAGVISLDYDGNRKKLGPRDR